MMPSIVHRTLTSPLHPSGTIKCKVGLNSADHIVCGEMRNIPASQLIFPKAQAIDTAMINNFPPVLFIFSQLKSSSAYSSKIYLRHILCHLQSESVRSGFVLIFFEWVRTQKGQSFVPSLESPLT